MPELKVDFKNLGAIRLMPLDTTSMFLPFGRPIADYVRGLVGTQNGARALLKQGSIEFVPRIGWTESTSRMLRTTGFGEQEREGIVESTVVSAVVSEEPPARSVEPPDPGVADFLPFGFPGAVAKDSNQAKMSPAIAPEELSISKPRIAALPLRLRMTFGPAPAARVKSAPKPIAAPPAAKVAPPLVAAPKPGPVPAAKPVPVATPVKVISPAAVQPKPVTVIPPPPKSAVAPPPAPQGVIRPALPQTSAPAPMPRPVAAPVSPKPAAPAPAAPKPAVEQSKPVQVTVPRVQPAPISVLESIVATPPPAAKAPTAPPAKPANAIIIGPKPPMPAVRPPAAPSPVEPPLAPEVVSREAPKEKEPIALGSTFEPHLSMGDEAESGSFITRIPLAGKIGALIVLLIVAAYFIFGKNGSTQGDGSQAVAVGEQGWSTEWASDSAGSRRGRQLTVYRPSVGMSDYQFQFVGQIESKALGWVFREADTKNYYGMKIENVRPGAMAISHFAVVDGRQSSDAQKPVGIDARPGTPYRVKLAVEGPRFTLYIGGEPVDFWTDNRLKSGAVGFMNERDERGATSSVQFSFAKGAK
jgi:hypothetical protein